jgi:polysaccharide deacetylase family protein (PEP-CTERM system associated)
MINAMSIDIEDWFQVGAFENVIARESWATLPSRVERNSDAVLELFAERNVKATFFTLGWVAERFPALIRRFADAGHELASHGSNHDRVFTMTPDAFRADISRARKAIEDASGQRIHGLSRAELLDRRAQSVGARGAGGGRLWLFVQRRARSRTTIMAGARRRAFAFRPLQTPT